MKYRNKPSVIEAYQITKELLERILFDEEPYPKGLHLGGASYHKADRKLHGWHGWVVYT